MKTRNLHTKIWLDTWFSELTSTEKLLFIYFLTNNYINLCGIYELPERIILFETGITSKQLQEIKKKLSERIIFIGDYIAIKNISKYDDYKGGKLEPAKNKQLEEIPTEVLEEIKKHKTPNRVSIGYPYPIYTPNSNSNSNKGGMGEKYPIKKTVVERTSKNSHMPCSTQEMEDIAKELNVNTVDVIRVHATIIDKIADGSFSEKKYKTVYYTLKQWVRMGIERGTIKENKPSKSIGEQMGYKNVKDVKVW